MRILKSIRAVLGNYHVKSGIYHFYRGEYKQAIDFLGRGLAEPAQIGDYDASVGRFYLTQAHLYAAEAADAEGAVDRSIEELESAAAVNPRFPDIQYRLARAFERAGRLPRAIEKYRRACEINPRYVEARTALGFALITSGRSEEAAEEFQEVFKIAVARIARPFREGLRCLATKQAEAAAQQFRDAFFAEPHRQSKLYRSGIDHLREENWDAAVTDLEEAITLSPGYADLHNYLGVALAESGQNAKAVTSLRESVRLNPNYAIAWLNLAYALSGPGEAREAEEILERLLAAEPGNSAARARLDELRGSRLDPRRLEARRAGGKGPDAMNAPLSGVGLSDVGRKRDFNEDAFAVDLENGLFAIADGMGGAAAGEVASGIAIATLTDYIARTTGAAEPGRPYGWDPRLSGQANRLRAGILMANEKIYRTIEEHEEMKGMGTTLVAALTRDSGVCVGHVGDSRIYLCREGQLRQLTSDHSWVNEQVSLGLLSREEASRHPFRNVITRALGSREQVSADVTEVPLSPGDRILLCSDGLTNMLDDRRILEVLESHPDDHERSAAELVARANEAGGDDNITVIVAGLAA